MTSLSARVESLEGASGEVFLDAYYAIRGKPKTEAEHRPFDRFRAMVDGGCFIDAALTLLPEGWEDLSIEAQRANGRVWVQFDDAAFLTYVARAATPALAILAAILRARGL